MGGHLRLIHGAGSSSEDSEKQYASSQATGTQHIIAPQEHILRPPYTPQERKELFCVDSADTSPLEEFCDSFCPLVVNDTVQPRNFSQMVQSFYVSQCRPYDRAVADLEHDDRWWLARVIDWGGVTHKKEKLVQRLKFKPAYTPTQLGSFLLTEHYISPESIAQTEGIVKRTRAVPEYFGRFLIDSMRTTVAMHAFAEAKEKLEKIKE